VSVPEPNQPRFAHFESTKVTSLYGLYTRHAEVARDIHQDALRTFTGNKRLTVDLVRESPIVPDNLQGTLGRLQQYDVVSVSSGVELGAVTNSSGVANQQTARAYEQAFAERDMPVFVEAAGNEGLTPQTGLPRVSDFARNSLVVGEANMGRGKPFVEEHSSRINPTLTADSPFNRGQKYQFYNVSPSLTGHEGLISKWIINKEIDQAFEQFKTTDPAKGLDEIGLSNAYVKLSDSMHRQYEMTEADRDKDIEQAFEQFKQSDPAKGLDESGLTDAYNKIRQEKQVEYEKAEAYRAKINAQVQGYMARPETLHSQIMAEFRQSQTIDRKGSVTGMDGTSFSAPEVAGYISGALYEQTRREDRNRPLLTKDEITTLAKMATVDTQTREGRTEPMPSRTNAAGQTFVEGGGHGVFRPDVFRKLLNEAYKRIETNPNIDRTSVTATSLATLAPGQTGDSAMLFRTPLPEGQAMVIDRMRFDLDYRVDGRVPNLAAVIPPGQNPYALSIQNAGGEGSNFSGWARQEQHFGETQRTDDTWRVRFFSGQDSTMQSASMTVYGYNQGGLMDQMMQYSQRLTAEMAPKPDAAPAAAAPAATAPQDKPPGIK
jgi:hypothetical protein